MIDSFVGSILKTAFAFSFPRNNLFFIPGDIQISHVITKTISSTHAKFIWARAVCPVCPVPARWFLFQTSRPILIHPGMLSVVSLLILSGAFSFYLLFVFLRVCAFGRYLLRSILQLHLFSMLIWSLLQ